MVSIVNFETWVVCGNIAIPPYPINNHFAAYLFATPFDSLVGFLSKQVVDSRVLGVE
jgi:hypothetical protein